MLSFISSIILFHLLPSSIIHSFKTSHHHHHHHHDHHHHHHHHHPLQQIIYPDQEALVDVSDELLKTILGQVQLSYLLVDDYDDDYDDDDDQGSNTSSVGAVDTDDSTVDACIISDASHADSHSDLRTDLLPSIVETSHLAVKRRGGGRGGGGSKGKRQYSLDSVLPWVDILSGGEKQRLSITR